MKKKHFRWLIISSFLISIMSCVSFRVTSPLPSDTTATVNGFSLNSSGQIVIPVVFSESVDISTVIANKTLILKFSKNPNETATLTWSPDNKTLTIVTVDKRDDLMSFHPDDGFSLTLLGIDNGNGVVKSTSGTILDGDYNKKAGGNYVKGFTVIG